MYPQTAFDEKSLPVLCDHLADKDPDLARILSSHGYPPFWTRPASFQTLVHIILEQQVSLASANAALNKLKEKAGKITPANILALSAEELRECYFSRQKISYTRDLANSILSNKLDIEALTAMDDKSIRLVLTKIKGIGSWSADVYLMMVLHRCDIFPLGDVALITSIKETRNLPSTTSKDVIESLASKWKPYQTIAAYILWHSYLCKRIRKNN